MTYSKSFLVTALSILFICDIAYAAALTMVLLVILAALAIGQFVFLRAAGALPVNGPTSPRPRALSPARRSRSCCADHRLRGCVDSVPSGGVSGPVRAGCARSRSKFPAVPGRRLDAGAVRPLRLNTVALVTMILVVAAGDQDARGVRFRPSAERELVSLLVLVT